MRTSRPAVSVALTVVLAGCILLLAAACDSSPYVTSAAPAAATTAIVQSLATRQPMALPSNTATPPKLAALPSNTPAADCPQDCPLVP